MAEDGGTEGEVFGDEDGAELECDEEGDGTGDDELDLRAGTGATEWRVGLGTDDEFEEDEEFDMDISDDPLEDEGVTVCNAVETIGLEKTGVLQGKAVGQRR